MRTRHRKIKQKYTEKRNRQGKNTERKTQKQAKHETKRACEDRLYIKKQRYTEAFLYIESKCIK